MKQSHRDHLRSIIQDFDTAILITTSATGMIRGRPMGIAEIDASGTMYFSSAIDSDKVQEIKRDPQVGVTLQGKYKFASISGFAKVTQDPGLIDRLWKESWRAFFVGGKTDPTLSIVIVEPKEGEYWDFSECVGIRYVLESAKAILTGHPVDISDGNARVPL